MDIGIITTYCNRPDGIKELVKSLKVAAKKAPHVNITQYILDDCSLPPLNKKLRGKQAPNYSIQTYRQDVNMGRKGYWLTLNNAMAVARTGGHKYIMHIADDQVVCKDFFSVVYMKMKEIAQTNKDGMLCLFLDSRTFDRFKGVPYQHIDGCHILPSHIYDAVDWEVPEIKNPPPYSSGAWRAFTYKIMDAVPNARVYHMDKAIVYHNTKDHGSVMNPIDREHDPMTTINWVEDCRTRDVNLVDPWRGFDLKKRKEQSTVHAVLYPYEGFGNVVQSLALYLQMYRKHVQVDVACDYIRGDLENKTFFYDVVTNYLDNKCYAHSNDSKVKYDIEIHANRMSHPKVVGDVAKFAEICVENEFWCDKPDRTVATFLPIDWKLFRGRKFKDRAKQYDVVLCNGAYNAKGYWLRKRYQRYPEVVQILKEHGLSVACVGLPDEYVRGCDDYIDLDLASTCDMVSQAKVFVTNCTGLLHFSNAVGVPTVAFYGPTSWRKNIHPRFHKFTKIIHADEIADCEYCQLDEGPRSDRWMNCHSWDCCYIDPNYFVEEILKCLDA